MAARNHALLFVACVVARAAAQQLRLLDAPPLGAAGAFRGVVTGLPPSVDGHKVFFFDGPALPGTPEWIGVWDKTHPNTLANPTGDKTGYLIAAADGSFEVPATWVTGVEDPGSLVFAFVVVERAFSGWEIWCEPCTDWPLTSYVPNVLQQLFVRSATGVVAVDYTGAPILPAASDTPSAAATPPSTPPPSVPASAAASPAAASPAAASPAAPDTAGASPTPSPGGNSALLGGADPSAVPTSGGAALPLQSGATAAAAPGPVALLAALAAGAVGAMQLRRVAARCS